MIPLRIQVPNGLTLRDSDGRSYPAGEAFDAPRSQFWLRRIADGSVVEVATAQAAKKSAPAPKKRKA